MSIARIRPVTLWDCFSHACLSVALSFVEVRTMMVAKRVCKNWAKATEHAQNMQWSHVKEKWKGVSLQHFLYSASVSDFLLIVTRQPAVVDLNAVTAGMTPQGRVVHTTILEHLCDGPASRIQEVMICTLIKYGASVNPGRGSTRGPLHNAVRQRNVLLVGHLVQNKADIDAKDSEGHDPLGHLQILLPGQYSFEESNIKTIFAQRRGCCTVL